MIALTLSKVVKHHIVVVILKCCFVHLRHRGKGSSLRCSNHASCVNHLCIVLRVRGYPSALEGTKIKLKGKVLTKRRPSDQVIQSR